MMKKFPTAAEVRALRPQDLDLWMIEQQLKEIKRCIFEAVHNGKDCITRIYMEQGTIDFLRDRGYLVIENENFYVIYWKKYQTGGVVSYNTLTKDNKYCNCCTNGIMDENTFNQLKEKWKNLCSKNLTF